MMQGDKLQQELLDKLKDFTGSLGNIREKCINDVNQNIDNIEDVKQRSFLKTSMDEALGGKLNVDNFINKLKEI